MQDPNSQTRLNKFEKRRKNTRRITILSILAGVFALFLFVSIIVSPSKETGKNKPSQTDIAENTKPKDENESKEENEESSDEDSEEEQSKKEEEQTVESDDIVTETVDSSDENVAHAYTANWKPIGTEQTGEHSINFSEGTTDRNEMEKAIKLATSLDEMTVWWLEREGDGQVKATVSDKSDQSEVYRVYIEWISEKGWQPTKVEALKENDQKWRFN